MAQPVYFLHISDTHLRPNKDFEIHGRLPYQNFERLVNAIQNLPVQLDFLMHTGDVTGNAEPEAYALASDLLATLDIPIYYAAGNHDDPNQMQNLPMGNRTAQQDALVSYTFDIKNERFIVLHTQGPHEEIGGSGRLPDGQFDFLTKQIDSTPGRISIFLHHCPIHLDCDWHDDKIDLLNGDDLHTTLIPYKEKIRGVFFGHIHRGVQIIKDGIHYASVGSTYMPLDLWPQGNAERDVLAPLPFNFVTLTDHSTIIKEHTIPL